MSLTHKSKNWMLNNAGRYIATKAQQAAYRSLKYAFNRAIGNVGKTYPYPPSRVTKDMGTQTPKIAARRRGGKYAAGKSAGRLKAKRPIKRLRKQKKMLIRGVEQTRESVGTQNGLYSVYLGHCSQPVNMLKEMLFLAIAKWMAGKVTSGGVQAVDEQIAQWYTGVNFVMDYKTHPTAALQQVVVTVPGPAPNFWSMRELANALLGAWNGLNPTNEYQLQAVSVLDDALAYVPIRMELQNAKVKVYAKSTLKIQNRSYGGDGTEADEVDNVPLYGKSYQCYGNGTEYVGSTQTGTVAEGTVRPLYANNTFGTFKFGVTALPDDLAEPPTALVFRGVKKYDKLRIEPGNIKTSILVDSYTTTLQSLISRIAVVANNPSKNTIGKFRLFGMEKIIETSEPPTVEIRTAFEANTRMAVSVIPSGTFTRPTFVAYQA